MTPPQNANEKHDPEAALAALGLELPPAPKPVAAYIPCRRAGNLVFVSGQIPIVGTGAGGAPVLLHTGIVPSGVTLEDARACARRCVLNALAILKAELGSLGAVKQVVRVGCFVACEPGFTEHPKVANAASELLVEVFGERGRHARAAVGSPSLPLGAPVEVELVVEGEG